MRAGTQADADTAASSDPWTVLRILRWTREFFARRGVATPRLDAEVLLASVLGVERIQLYVQYDRPLDPEERERMRVLVRRRGRGEPVQYLVGSQEFWSISFRVRPGVLIPRPDTEVLVEEALAEIRRDGAQHGAPLRLADVGTGSGCVAVALATELPTAVVYAGDVEDVPLELAAANAAAAGVAERVRVLRAEGLLPLVAAAEEPLHLVVSNPPYIPTGELPGLMTEVRDFEPVNALVAGPDGLAVIRPLVAAAARPGSLVSGGALALEVAGAAQAETVRHLLEAAGFEAVRVRDDYAGIPRVVVGRRANG